MTLEHYWVRMLIRSAIWAIICLGIAKLLGVDLTWRVIVLICIMGFVDYLIDGVLPLRKKEETNGRT